MSPTPDTTVIPRLAATAGEPPEQSLESTLAATRRLGAVAAAAALVALLVGGTAMSALGGASVADVGVVRLHPAPALIGSAALAAVSLFDAFTVPALHRTLRSSGTVLILVATGCALTGDLLGIVGRTVQHAAAQTALMGGSAPSVAALDQTQRSLNAFGFVLVAVSFATFGVLYRRAGHRWLGATALSAGLLTGLGQVPGLQPLFYLANVFFVAWYVGLIRQFGARSGTPC